MSVRSLLIRIVSDTGLQVQFNKCAYCYDYYRKKLIFSQSETLNTFFRLFECTIYHVADQVYKFFRTFLSFGQIYRNFCGKLCQNHKYNKNFYFFTPKTVTMHLNALIVQKFVFTFNAIMTDHDRPKQKIIISILLSWYFWTSRKKMEKENAKNVLISIFSFLFYLPVPLIRPTKQKKLFKIAQFNRSNK